MPAISTMPLTLRPSTLCLHAHDVQSGHHEWWLRRQSGIIRITDRSGLGRRQVVWWSKRAEAEMNELFLGKACRYCLSSRLSVAHSRQRNEGRRILLHQGPSAALWISGDAKGPLPTLVRGSQCRLSQTYI
jgi:hypothetical protein